MQSGPTAVPVGARQFEAGSLEVHAVDQCNLRCIQCSHESPSARRRFADPDTTAASLRSLFRFYSTPLVKILGGEPMLHPDLSELIAGAKTASGSTVRVVTNGTLLTRWPDRVGPADEIHVSVYPESVVPTVEEAQSLCDTYGFSITFERFDQFRMHRRQPSDDRMLTQEIFETCQMYGPWNCHTVWEDRLYPCPPAATWGKDAAFVPLLPEKSLTSDQVIDLLTAVKPFKTCQNCLGSVGRLVDHGMAAPGSAVARPAASDDVDHDFMQELGRRPGAWNGCYEYTVTLKPVT